MYRTIVEVEILSEERQDNTSLRQISEHLIKGNGSAVYRLISQKNICAEETAEIALQHEVAPEQFGVRVTSNGSLIDYGFFSKTKVGNNS